MKYQTRDNIWNLSLGPFFRESALERHGVNDMGRLVSLAVKDVTVYPHGQFTLRRENGEVFYPRPPFTSNPLGDCTLEERTAVTNVWSDQLVPAIDDRVIDEWTAAAWILGRPQVGEFSLADKVAQGVISEEDLALQVCQDLARMRL